MITIPFEGGKYIIESGAGFSRVLRYGEPWLDLNSVPGSEFFLSLIDNLVLYRELEKEVEESKYEAGYGHNSSLMDMVKELVNYRNKYNQLKMEPQLAIPDGWLPTAENINKLPGPVRSYIHELTANSDPAGTIQENVFLKDLRKEGD